MQTGWNYSLAWLVVAVAAVVLAMASPPHPSALGRLPSDVGQKLDRVPAAASRSEGRMLALVTFRREHRPDAESWIDGLNLRYGSVNWVRMPVVQDPGDPSLRAQAEVRLMAHFSGSRDRANLVPVVTDRALFLRSVGVGDTSQAVVLVINRYGDVLARVAGGFDEGKAAMLFDSLDAPEL